MGGDQEGDAVVSARRGNEVSRSWLMAEELLLKNLILLKFL
jgi:hypothetical protein